MDIVQARDIEYICSILKEEFISNNFLSVNISEMLSDNCRTLLREIFYALYDKSKTIKNQFYLAVHNSAMSNVENALNSGTAEVKLKEIQSVFSYYVNNNNNNAQTTAYDVLDTCGITRESSYVNVYRCRDQLQCLLNNYLSPNYQENLNSLNFFICNVLEEKLYLDGILLSADLLKLSQPSCQNYLITLINSLNQIFLFNNQGNSQNEHFLSKLQHAIAELNLNDNNSLENLAKTKLLTLQKSFCPCHRILQFSKEVLKELDHYVTVLVESHLIHRHTDEKATYSFKIFAFQILFDKVYQIHQLLQEFSTKLNIFHEQYQKANQLIQILTKNSLIISAFPSDGLIKKKIKNTPGTKIPVTLLCLLRSNQLKISPNDFDLSVQFIEPGQNNLSNQQQTMKPIWLKSSADGDRIMFTCQDFKFEDKSPSKPKQVERVTARKGRFLFKAELKTHPRGILLPKKFFLERHSDTVIPIGHTNQKFHADFTKFLDSYFPRPGRGENNFDVLEMAPVQQVLDALDNYLQLTTQRGLQWTCQKEFLKNKLLIQCAADDESLRKENVIILQKMNPPPCKIPKQQQQQQQLHSPTTVSSSNNSSPSAACYNSPAATMSSGDNNENNMENSSTEEMIDSTTTTTTSGEYLSFWFWFWNCLKLIRSDCVFGKDNEVNKSLASVREMWKDGLIVGFIDKSVASEMNFYTFDKGAFVLRFSETVKSSLSVTFGGEHWHPYSLEELCHTDKLHDVLLSFDYLTRFAHLQPEEGKKCVRLAKYVNYNANKGYVPKECTFYCDYRANKNNIHGAKEYFVGLRQTTPSFEEKFNQMDLE